MRARLMGAVLAVAGLALSAPAQQGGLRVPPLAFQAEKAPSGATVVVSANPQGSATAPVVAVAVRVAARGGAGYRQTVTTVAAPQLRSALQQAAGQTRGESHVVVVIVGAISPPAVLALAARIFAASAATGPAARQASRLRGDGRAVPAGAAEPVPAATPEAPQGPRAPAAPQVMTIRWPGPVAGAKDLPALAMLGADLFGGPAARERRSLVDKWRAALAVEGGLSFPGNWSAYQPPGEFAARVWFRPAVSPTLVRELVFRQIHEIEANGISPDELRRTEIWTAAEWLRRGQTAAARARRLARAEWDTGSPGAANEALRPMLQVTAEQMQAAAASYLRDAQARITVRPCRAPGGGDCPPPSPAQAGASGGSVSWPAIVAWRPPAPAFDAQFQNGLRLIIIHDANLPLVTVQLSVRAAPPAQARWSRMLARVLLAGTARESGDALSLRIQGVGGTLWARAGRRRFTIGGSALAPYAGTLLRHVAAVAIRPAIPAAALQRAELNVAAWQAWRQTDPGWLARREAARWRAATAGSGAQPPLDRKNLLAFAHTLLLPNNGARLVVVGAVDPDLVRAMVEQYFVDAWPFGYPAAAAPKPVPGGGRLLLVSVRGARAAYAFVTAVPPLPGASGYAAWQVALRLVAGSTSAVPTAQLPAALRAAMVRRAELAAAPPAASRVEGVKARMMTAWMVRWQAQNPIAWAWTRGEAGSMLAGVAAVTPAAVQAAARKYLAPRLTVVAGDAAALKVELSHLSHGSITILNAQGAMIGSYPPEGPARGPRRILRPH